MRKLKRRAQEMHGFRNTVGFRSRSEQYTYDPFTGELYAPSRTTVRVRISTWSVAWR